MLELAQKRIVGMLPGLEDFLNEERLDKLGLFPLERRRLWFHLIKLYKSHKLVR